MIVIPMAGLSRRFTEAGYTIPKYMLQAHGKSLFAHSVGSFAAYFESVPFLVIARDVAGTRDFIASEVAALGIKDASTVFVDQPTAGQAETVALGLERAGVNRGTAVTVFNIDTFRPGFRFPTQFDMKQTDGYLEVFRGSGPNWSYVKPAQGDSYRVIETAEKVAISDLCCTGLYHFRTAQIFLDSYRQSKRKDGALKHNAEHYVAPIYNEIIQRGGVVNFSLVNLSEVIFCGIPTEYLAFLDGPAPKC